VDVLINNISWALRHVPVVGVFGAGDYRLQPIYVDNLAQAAVEKVAGTTDEVVEAIGPETFTYRKLVENISRAIGVYRPIVPVSPTAGYWSCRLLGALVGVVVIAREEIQGLMENRLYVDAPPLGRTRLSEWVAKHCETLGRHYTSEMSRRTDRASSYRTN
jgi:NADH dehydrogenase